MNKYKQYAEWFQREQLRQIHEGYEGKTGERALALHLQQYVFNQGVEFTVEPSSVSGEADLVLRDSHGGHIIIDAKYIDSKATPSTILRKIAEGFNQVARYCNDFNETEGFLGVFVNADIAINIELNEEAGFSYIKIGNINIYYVEINIAQRPSASKVGKPNLVTISSSELINELRELED